MGSERQKMTPYQRRLVNIGIVIQFYLAAARRGCGICSLIRQAKFALAISRRSRLAMSHRNQWKQFGIVCQLQ